MGLKKSIRFFNDRQVRAVWDEESQPVSVTNQFTSRTRRTDYLSQNSYKRALQKMTDGKLSSLLSIKEPVIIRTANLQEDQKLMYDFLVTHYTEKHLASRIVNKLI